MTRRRSNTGGPHDERSVIRRRLSEEIGTLGLGKDAPIVLLYPSPYRVGMSSLGFQTLYRQLNTNGSGAHRAFLPDAWEPASLLWPAHKLPIFSYEGDRPISSYSIIGVSIAYELEVVGLIRALEGSGIPVLAAQRGKFDPIIVAGGPLTTSNPSVVLPFVDVLICGEGEILLPQAIELIRNSSSRNAAIESTLKLPHTCSGQLDPEHIPTLPGSLAKVDSSLLPAHSAILTPNTELSEMFLIEPERGCSRRCTFCVMRGESTGGMRLLKSQVPLGLIPDEARKVGLVGAAVTDHPELEKIVSDIVQSGRGIGISSLRADRLTPTLLANLQAGGYRTITVASDGISERMRKLLDRKISSEDLISAAKLVSKHKFHRLKIYQMIGAPGETDEDVDELIAFIRELSDIVRITLTFSTFVAKRNTPLDGQPFIGIKQAERRLTRIRSGLKGRVEIRPQPPKWAYVEYELAQRGLEVGHAALEAVHRGGRFSDWMNAFRNLPVSNRPLVFGNEERRAMRRGFAAKHPQLPKLSILS